MEQNESSILKTKSELGYLQLRGILMNIMSMEEAEDIIENVIYSRVYASDTFAVVYFKDSKNFALTCIDPLKRHIN